jgi:predicted nuclease of restriction endonuclease-like (RecB) superfamily
VGIILINCFKVNWSTFQTPGVNDLKKKVASSQTKAVLAVNKELVLLYWSIGKKILENQNNAGWGAKVIDLLSKDLSTAFPEMKGFSIRNLKYMRSFAEAYTETPFVQQLVAQIPWGHIVRLLDLVKSKEERLWYIEETIKNGWSRKVLIHQIELKLYKRQIKNEKTHNFKTTLTPSQSELAHQTLKDPYIFDFLSIGKEAQERDIENELTTHITKFLLELGAGFSYVGRQVHLEVGKQDYYIDLLFYHLKLRCYIVIELKTGGFKPEHVGKINFYLSAVDDLRRHPGDNPSIGIILCQSKEKIIVEYALRNVNRPIGVSQYKLFEALPKNLKANLPSVEEIEKELSKTPVKVKKKVTRSQKQ